ncbi:MAG: hypothetical protein JSW40_04030 [Candidatus Omnitrophota bacterium]|nr:MAG: hypothetical protein JSW40_04030 [Candidatus Omnitrophota bacterium]
MKKPNSPQEEKERQMILTAARVLNVSVFGVNILGGNIYLNKLGLAQKARQYDSKIRFEYEWVKMAEDDDQKAICKCRLMQNDKPLCDWVLGECSTQTMSMRTLKGYQNHMAQTRAKNRAILETFGVRIHEDMLIEWEKLYEKAKETPAIQVGVSVEEMQMNGNGKQPYRRQSTPKPNKAKSLFATDKEKERIKKLAMELGAKTEAKIIPVIEKITGLKVDMDNLTKVQAGNIIAGLLHKQIGKNNAENN